MAAFTVQEEVGARGARVAAHALNPDLALVIDSTPAYDLPTMEDSDGRRPENTVYNSRLDAGPAIYLADSSTLSDPRLVRHLVETAEALGIPYQFRQPGGGGTDAGTIHRQRAGIPSVSVSVPGRYAHTPAGIARLSDWKNTLALLHAALVRLPSDILVGDRQSAIIFQETFMKSLIQKLVETPSPSGHEAKIREVIRTEVEPPPPRRRGRECRRGTP